MIAAHGASLRSGRTASTLAYAGPDGREHEIRRIEVDHVGTFRGEHVNAVRGERGKLPDWSWQSYEITSKIAQIKTVIG
jgi:hypothetical protein